MYSKQTVVSEQWKYLTSRVRPRESREGAGSHPNLEPSIDEIVLAHFTELRNTDNDVFISCNRFGQLLEGAASGRKIEIKSV